MSDPIAPPEFEHELRRAINPPPADAVFVRNLRDQLAHRAARPAERARVRRTWRWAVGLTLVAVIAIFLIGPGTFAKAMRRLIGYLPGFGLVDLQSSLRGLDAASSQARDGVTLTAEQAVLDEEQTVIVLRVEGLAADDFPRTESGPMCSQSPRLRLSDGTALTMQGSSSRGWGSGYEQRLTFPAVPSSIASATLEVACLEGTAPGAAPENWALPLTFAATDLLPTAVIEVSESTVPVASATAINPALSSTAPPDVVATAAPQPALGVRLVVERAVPVEDGYVLVGHTEWADARIVEVSPMISAAQDAGGHVIPVEPAYLGDLGMSSPAANQWGVRLYGQIFDGPVTLRAERASFTLRDPIQMAFDAGATPALGQTWDLRQPLRVLDITAEVRSARFIRQGDLHGFELSILADPVLAGLDLQVELGAGGGGSGGGSVADGAGQIQSYALRDGVVQGPQTLTARSGRLAGSWSIVWMPPAWPSANTPTAVPQACLTLPQWQDVMRQAAPLPADLTGRLIAYGRIVRDDQPPSPENYGVFTYDLSTGVQHSLGAGVWPSLSPDGQHAAYAGADGLHVVDLTTGIDRVVPHTLPNDYAPRWSPDGSQIAFVRVQDLNLYAVAPDGSGLTRLTDDTAYEQLIGWAPDGQHIVLAQPDADGQIVKVLDVATGIMTESDIRLTTTGVGAALSPDGQTFALIQRIVGQMGAGLFLSPGTGANPRLLVQLSHWGVSDPVWSPDGRWVIVSVTNLDQFAPTSMPAVIEAATCRAYALPAVEGTVSGWAPVP